MGLVQPGYKALMCILIFMTCTCSLAREKTRRVQLPPTGEELRILNEEASRKKRVARCREMEPLIESMREYCTDYRSQITVGTINHRIEATCRAISDFDIRCQETLANDNER